MGEVPLYGKWSLRKGQLMGIDLSVEVGGGRLLVEVELGIVRVERF